MENYFYFAGYVVAAIFYCLAIFAKNKSKIVRIFMLIVADIGFIGSEVYYLRLTGDVHHVSVFLFLIFNILIPRIIFATRKTWNRIVKNKMIFFMIPILFLTLLVFMFGTENQREIYFPIQNVAIIAILAYFFRKGIITNELIIEQKEALDRQKEILEERNKEVLDSINYARRIQATILPPLREVKKNLKDSFVLYLPKDIVAGDFYWMEAFEAENQLFFAVCDCTGHGVPGAMVSVVCQNALNRTVREFEIKQPSRILDKTTELVVQAFSMNNADNDEIKDGMDASLCALNTKTLELQWAGAHNPLWIVFANGEFTEYKADKQTIGKSNNLTPFTNHLIQLEKGDCLYIFTDGFADQFGGELNKKFQRKALKKLLISINAQTMEQQRETIFNIFETWRGKNEQTDDVCLIGLRI